MWFDSHCHWLDDAFSSDRATCLAEAHAAGCCAFLVPSVNVVDWSRVAAFCDAHPSCYPAYGIHPYVAAHTAQTHKAALMNYLALDTTVALGEIGLDGCLPATSFAAQEAWFLSQLSMAQEFDLPVILHLNHAIDWGLKYLRRVRVRGGIVHAFNGSLQQAQQLIELGFALGFGGVVTNPRATKIRRLLCALPLESVVVETDAPYLPPIWQAGQRHTPEQLPQIGALIAQLRGLNTATLAQMTAATVTRCVPRAIIR